ncbi:hypothetical protein [Pedobacter heparinus]|uniref:hypothetical protein n=1 Tax=Pedobacter heparinus TaxID=984 RepID=UPI00292DFEEE|nr:hypothetical protein [Pedobacter heparinus]
MNIYIKQIIQQFSESIERQLPLLEIEVNRLITIKSTNISAIGNCLDTLLSLTIHGFADDVFVRLLEYYKTVDAEGALFYWNEYDNTEE